MITGSHRYPTMEEVIYGRPAAEAVAQLAEAFGAQRLFLVTTRSLDTGNGAVAALNAALGPRFVGAFSAIRAHSPREDVVACADAARAAGADLLVAIGGGSVIDAVKVVQLCLWGDVKTVEGVGQLFGRGARDLEPGVRMIALPTTLSAAEFTPFAGVTDTARRSKEGYGHPRLAPRAVVLDPRLTLETPAQLWFSTGLKAVDHAVEQLCNPERAPYADALAEAGLKRSHRWPRRDAGRRRRPRRQARVPVRHVAGDQRRERRARSRRQPRHRPHAGRRLWRAARDHLVRDAAGGAGVERNSQRRPPGRGRGADGAAGGQRRRRRARPGAGPWPSHPPLRSRHRAGAVPGQRRGDHARPRRALEPKARSRAPPTSSRSSTSPPDARSGLALAPGLPKTGASRSFAEGPFGPHHLYDPHRAQAGRRRARLRRARRRPARPRRRPDPPFLGLDRHAPGGPRLARDLARPARPRRQRVAPRRRLPGALDRRGPDRRRRNAGPPARADRRLAGRHRRADGRGGGRAGHVPLAYPGRHHPQIRPRGRGEDPRLHEPERRDRLRQPARGGRRHRRLPAAPPAPNGPFRPVQEPSGCTPTAAIAGTGTPGSRPASAAATPRPASTGAASTSRPPAARSRFLSTSSVDG